jgi:Holliday junction DNA helicase RuvA
MIDFLDGTLIVKEPTRAVIDCHGVGYQVMIPLSTCDALPAPGVAVRLLTVFVVREDAHLLYGFATPAERRMFQTLTSVAGVGPKTALMALSREAVHDLAAAITTGDAAMIQKLPGIGRKLAARIVAELRDSLTDMTEATGLTDMTASASPAAPAGGDARRTAVAEAQAALVALGYPPQEARRIVAAAARAHPAADAETLFRAAFNM